MVLWQQDLSKRVAKAIPLYWQTREHQGKKQGAKSGQKDYGARAAVTGGAQMDGFILLLSELIQEAGVSAGHIFHKQSLQLPGFFRPTKEWDLLVVRDGLLILALEAKSQVGPSFGNNFNNRTEEAMGSALDLWTAFREPDHLAQDRECIVRGAGQLELSLQAVRAERDHQQRHRVHSNATQVGRLSKADRRAAALEQDHQERVQEVVSTVLEHKRRID